MSNAPETSERVIASWDERPFTSHRRRRWVVEHRVIAEAIPGVGADIRHEVRCQDHDDTDGWIASEVYEVRETGVDKLTRDDRWWSS